MAKVSNTPIRHDDAEVVLRAITETAGLLSETASHLVENAVPLDEQSGAPVSFSEAEMPVARILSESAVPVATAAPAASLAAPEFAQMVPRLAP